MRVVDPDRVGEVERNPVDALAVSRDEVDSLPHCLLDPEGAAPARQLRLTLEDIDGAQVERCLRPFGIQKPSITGRQRLVERLVGPRHSRDPNRGAIHGRRASFGLQGMVAEIWRYPVKSMAGERLGSCEVAATGVDAG